MARSDMSRNSEGPYLRLPSESADQYGRYYQSRHGSSQNTLPMDNTYLSMPGLGDPSIHGGYTPSIRSFHSTLSQTPSTRPLIGDDGSSTLKPHTCLPRADATGPWNLFKAWYIFFLHVCASAALFASLIYIDGQQFLIGSGGYFDSPLHQAQVNGLLSFALVLIRIIAGCCSTLLSWRIVYILLEKSSISLVEITRLSGWRIPLLPGGRRKTSLLWIIWASIATLLLWPQAFSAPFASSAISWIPGKRLQNEMETTEVPKLGHNMSLPFSGLKGFTNRYSVIIDGAASKSKDAEFFFNSPKIPSRRYFNATKNVPAESKINIRAPYFDVKLKWVNGNDYDVFDNVWYTEYFSVNGNGTFLDTKDGFTYIMRSTPWTSSDLPRGPSIYRATLPIVVNLMITDYPSTWWDGTKITNTTTCDELASPYFKVLPDVPQFNYTTSVTYGKEVLSAGFACKLAAMATITAGAFEAKDCTVSSSGNEYASCLADENTTPIQPDWLSKISVDFLSDTLEYIIVRNGTGFWISDDLTEYAEGMLRFGYNTAWNAFMTLYANHTEPATFQPSEPIVAAAVERSKLYIWLGMNAGLTISSILVLWMQCGSRVTTIRDTDLAALTIDLTEISHGERTRGLCNAAALNKADRKLPKMKWAGDVVGVGYRGSGVDCECRRRVVFVGDEIGRDVQGTPLSRVFPNKDVHN